MFMSGKTRRCWTLIRIYKHKKSLRALISQSLRRYLHPLILMLLYSRMKNGTSTPQFERYPFRLRRAAGRCFRTLSFSYASFGVSEFNTPMNRLFIFSSSLRMNPLEYFEISDPLGIYLRRLLFNCSIEGFSHGECSWQK